MATDNKNRLTGYLLGNLSEEERERVEREYLAGEDVWRELCATEDELIEAYVRGRLSGEEKIKFENRFLATPAKRSRVAVAQMLLDPALRREFVGEPDEKSPLPIVRRSRFIGVPAIAFSLAAMLALAAGLVWVALQNRQMHSQLAQARAMQQQQQRELEALRQQIASRPPEGSVAVDAGAQPTISLLLEPDLGRRGGGDSGNILPIPSVPSDVVLALDLRRDDVAGYEVAVQTPEGREIQRVAGLRSQPSQGGGRVVALKLPSRLLPRGVYLATLFRADAQGRRTTVDSYSFSVLRPL